MPTWKLTATGMSTNARMKFCLLAACFADGVDLGLFPASFRAMERDMEFTPSELGNLCMKTGLAYCSFSLVWGVLADRMNRKVLLMITSAALAVVMVATAHAESRLWFSFLRIAAGAITAAANPIMQSLISQVVPKEERGNAFGQLILGTIAAGACASGLVAHFAWRSAYLVTGLANAAICALLWVVQPDIQSQGELEELSGDTVRVELAKAAALSRIRTFPVLIASGMMGCIPWSALQFLQLYFESIGHSTGVAASLITFLAIGKAIGAWLGGIIGDCVACRMPRHGRAFIAQTTVLLGIVTMWVLLRWCPQDPSYFRTTALASFLFGLTSTWAGPAVDRPIWSELAPDNSAMAMAVWTFIAGAFSSLMGAPIVGWVADSVLGYKEVENDNASNAAALGTALLICTVGPWMVCFLFYSLVHVTYPLDTGSETRPFAKSAAVKSMDAFHRGP
mmetsp:Transcript_56241/g.131737  ORF Transcript_56241/g.131737 Transcript_56241/m.131737 type:complete len:452 (+) Transcript_56241:106-1461(+)